MNTLNYRGAARQQQRLGFSRLQEQQQQQQHADYNVTQKCTSF
jgi:hypothetical protein